MRRRQNRRGCIPMKTILLQHDYEKAAAKLASRFPAPSHADQFIRCDTELRSPNDGVVTALLLCNVIPPELHKVACELFRTVNRPPSNRPTAMGTVSLPRSTSKDGAPSPRSGVNKLVLDASGAKVGRVGWDGPDHEAPLTIDHREMLLGNEPLIKLVDELYKRFLSTFYAKQALALAKVPHCRLFGTSFSTIYIAKNFRTAYHRDTGNLPGAMTCLVPLGNFVGGELVLARWRIAIAFKPGDLLLFDPQQLHGNLPIIGQRLSAAFYCAARVANASDEGES